MLIHAPTLAAGETCELVLALAFEVKLADDAQFAADRVETEDGALISNKCIMNAEAR